MVLGAVPLASYVVPDRDYPPSVEVPATKPLRLHG
jgi:hypothetical protein